ncbi:MAG: cupin [Spirochaetes bacterium]|nr:MAG: cupin [Spirochaetota bacterium]
MARFFFGESEIEREILDAGALSRKIKAHGEKSMIVEVFFSKNAIGAFHSHPHEQLTYCLEGSFDFALGKESFRLGPGDSLLIPSGVGHGVLCLAEGRLLDMFSPPREDFLAPRG